jgi:hypothetical protein
MPFLNYRISIKSRTEIVPDLNLPGKESRTGLIANSKAGSINNFDNKTEQPDEIQNNCFYTRIA